MDITTVGVTSCDTDFSRISSLIVETIPSHVFFRFGYGLPMLVLQLEILPMSAHAYVMHGWRDEWDDDTDERDIFYEGYQKYGVPCYYYSWESFL